jgi:hypothetical protein
MGVKLDKGQETDERMQLYYQLALLAFDSGEDYWGYRLLGNAVHYLQDMSQPYHVKLIINLEMLDLSKAIHRVLCDVDRNLSTRFPDAGEARCQLDENTSKAVIDGAWYVGTYHGLFEDFALALLETNGFSGREYVLHDTTDVAALTWRASENAPLLDLKSVIRQAQAHIVPLAEKTAEENVAAFGKRYIGSQATCEEALRDMGTHETREYRMGSSYYLVDGDTMKNAQFQGRNRLVELTHSLLRIGATWTRQFVYEATRPRSAATTAELDAFRQRLKARCR